MVPGIEQKRLRSFDGTEIAYQVRGEGPPVVLVNGLGGTYEAFRHLYTALGLGHRVVCWDYRGLFQSAVPRDRGTLAIPYHCDDLAAILDAERIDRAVLCGWSMGVQVSFEFLRKRSDRVAGIVAINGTSGRPFHTVMAARVVRHVIPLVLRAMRAQADLVGRATRRMVEWDGVIPMMQRFGMVSAALDVDAFREVASSFKTLDWGVYSEIMTRLGEHDASDLLDRVTAPLLIITGDRDVLTPVATAERIHRRIPHSRLVVIEGGTHYTPVEYPRVIQDELGRFLARVPGYAPAAGSAAVAGG